MRGKVVVMTGATSGIGAAAAEALARLGARVVFTARDAGRGQETLDKLRRANPDAAHAVVPGELSTLAGMGAAAAALKAVAPRVDVLVNNAGGMFARREITPDGLEKTFAVDHMAYFVVTLGLAETLSDGSRVVSTASAAHGVGRIDFDDLPMAKGYSSFAAYGRAKLCNILFTRELARRWAGRGIAVGCFHPGGVSTRFGQNMGGVGGALFRLAGPLLLTPEQGADTLVWLASSDEAADAAGGYYVRRRLTPPSPAGRDDAMAARLWDVSARIAGAGVPA